jgi:putative redox protein
MEVIAQYLGGSKFEVAARGHRVICDQPLDNGGSDAGMSPPEFLLASLATCAAYYAAQYLKTRGLPAEDLGVRVTAEKALKPARLASFRIEVTGLLLEERHQEGMLRAVKACLIHNTLLNEPRIVIAINPVTRAQVQPQASLANRESGLELTTLSS